MGCLLVIFKRCLYGTTYDYYAFLVYLYYGCDVVVIFGVPAGGGEAPQRRTREAPAFIMAAGFQ